MSGRYANEQLARNSLRLGIRAKTSSSRVPNAKSGDNYVAYQVMGEGPFDLVYVPGFISHLDLQMEHPLSANFIRRLASFCRLIRFDKRGTGLSDRTGPLPTIEEPMDDVRAVMDAVGSERAALWGFSEGGPTSIVFAATYPQRTSALILYAAFPRRAWAPDYVWGLGIHVRAGIHTEECEVIGEKGGIAVHIGARIGALAAPDEVLVSRTVSDLVAGSGLRFEERGTHCLKGVPGSWQLLAAA